MATFFDVFPALDDNSGIIVSENWFKTNLVRLLKSERIPDEREANSICQYFKFVFLMNKKLKRDAYFYISREQLKINEFGCILTAMVLNLFVCKGLTIFVDFVFSVGVGYCVVFGLEWMGST